MRKTSGMNLVLFGLLALPVYAGSINKSITIEAGAESGGQSSVNGSITVGSNAVVSGSLETVNGAIHVDDGARVQDLQTVNGSIDLGSNSRSGNINGVNGGVRLGEAVVVDGEISLVNGRISMQRGSRVGRDVSNVNGQFEISGSEIAGNLTTVNGDVLLTEQSVLHGDLVIEKPSGWNSKKQRTPRVVIGPGSRVGGKVHAGRKVELYLHESASVGGVSGEMALGDAIRFSGDHP